MFDLDAEVEQDLAELREHITGLRQVLAAPLPGRVRRGGAGPIRRCRPSQVFYDLVAGKPCAADPGPGPLAPCSGCGYLTGGRCPDCWVPVCADCRADTHPCTSGTRGNAGV